MAKYNIIPSSRTIVQSPISIGHKAEKGVEAIEFDLTAWVETYGSGTATIFMRRWGDEIPYPVALELDENNKATWTLSDIDTAKAGMAYAQLNYIVGDEVVKKSDIYTFRVMDSLTGEGEPPEAYESWLEHLTHLAAEAMAEVLDIEGIVTDKTLTFDGGIADAKAAGDALTLKADKATTYTKTEVDQMIEDVEVETDTTLTVSGAPADAAETGRQLWLINESLGDVRADLGALLAYGIEFVSGKYDESESGSHKNSWSRIRNEYLISVDGIKSLTLPTGFDAQIHYFGINKNWISYEPTWQTIIDFTEFSDTVFYIGLTVRKTASPNADIRSEVDTVRDGVVIKIFRSIVDQNLFNYTANWESGKYNELNYGAKYASAARIRNMQLIPLSYVKSIVLPSGYDAQIHVFDSEKQWQGYDPSWKTSFDASQVNQSIKYVGLTIRKTASPNADITADIPTLSSGIKFYSILGNHKSISDVYPDVVDALTQMRRTKNVSNNNYLSRNAPLVLFHFSDIHQEQGNLRDIVNFAEENSSLIDDIICTGDIVGARFQNGMSWFDGVSGAENIILAIGNHDVMNASSGYDDAQTATLADIYAQYIEPYYENWGLTSDPSSGLTYYYKDYPNSKVRLIILDCMLDNVDADADALQYTWFVNTLANAVNNGYYVVVANHCFPAGATFVSSNWTNEDYQNAQTYLDARYPEAVDAFIGNGGKFVCWLQGHSHADYYMQYTGTNGTQIAISVDAASKINAEPFTDVNRIDNNRSYNSANLVCIDSGAEVIKIVKFGAKTNYKLIPRHSITIGFNGSIISQT